MREPQNFGGAVKDAERNDLNLFFEIDSEFLDSAELWEMKSQKIGIFIGPEGGWSPEELSMIKRKAQENKNFKLAGLGKLTLRAETAAVVSAWLICHRN